MTVAIDVLDVTLVASILLRLAGVVLSIVLLYRVRDRRFAFLTLLLSLMAIRQLFTITDTLTAVSEVPGLLVSVLALAVVYYMIEYVRQEQATMAELTETNRTLRENRNRFEATLAASPEDLLVFDAEDRCIEVISGNDADVTEALVGRSAHEIWPPEVADRVVDAIEMTRRNGTVEQVEYSMNRDATTRWYDARTARLEDGSDEPGIEEPEADESEAHEPGTDGGRVLFSRREVTERKERERDLRRFRRVVDAAGAAVYITDRSETIVYVNPAFESITGYEASEAIGRTPRLLSSGAHDEEYYERLWATIGSGRTWREEVINERKSGERYYANQTIAPVLDADGAIEEYVSIQIDITDRKLRERQLAVLDRILRHNLRNDLSLVLGHAATIETETDDSELRESAELIRDTGQSLLEKAEKERRVVRLITENPHPYPTEIRSIIDRCVADVRSGSESMTVDVDAPAEVTAVTLPALETAITEILDNAVEYGPEEPNVRITVETTSDEVTIRVADDGPGIPEQERGILTDDHDIDALYHGSGIGLWFVYWVVHLSGGHLSFEEREPHGSVVVITLDRI